MPTCASIRKLVSAEIWHRRLGHFPIDQVKRMIPASKLTKGTAHSDFHCEICPFAKQTRSSFMLTQHKTSNIFDIVHGDVWGPFQTPTMSGARYFFTLVDDCSRFTWVYLMQQKDQVSTFIREYFTLIHTQFEKRVKVFRSDNGSEFINGNLQDFFKRQGCIHQTSCVYTPQQNGAVERKHRHLLEVARGLRLQAHLPKLFWGDCVLTATYIINRLPTRILNNKSPFEALFGKSPSLDHMRVFGCLVYACTLKRDRDKMDPRSSACVFLGYSPTQKGYKLLCLKNNKVFVSRDTIFHEDVYPYYEKAHTDEATSVHIPVPLPVVLSDDAVVDKSFNGAVPTENISPVAHQENMEQFNGAVPTENTLDDIVEDPKTLRRSTRQTKPPYWQKDYVCTQAAKQTSPHSLSKVISYSQCSPSHASFLVQLDTSKEPTCYTKAKSDPKWQEAMQREIQALEQNQTWTITSLPKDKTLVDCKWIYKVKLNSDGSIERYKARLVAKGFTQVEGLDFHETFAPVAKMTTIRCCLALAAIRGWPLFHLDVDNAFVHGILEEEVYMRLPPGFYNEAKKQGMVCRLHKSLYGLKQSSRQWFAKLNDALLQFGFTPSLHDHSLFTLQRGKEFIILLVYVDDIMLTGTSLDLIASVKAFLHECFRIKDLGHLKYFLGLEITRSSSGIFLHQRKYALEILEDAGFTDCKPALIPMEIKHGLSLSSATPLEDPLSYRRLVGRLLYLAVTRPDLAYPVHILSQFMQQPTIDHLNAAHKVLRYIKGAPAQGIFFSGKSTISLSAYCDADWAACPLTRRSLSGYCVLLGSSLISWKTKKQTLVARSSAESEYRAMAAVCAELIWLTGLFQDLGCSVPRPIALYCDNTAALHIARNPVFHERTKHIEIDCHFVRHQISTDFINPAYVASSEQPADLLTKPLSASLRHHLIGKLGISNFLHAPT
ncbi:unnamed protein product [Rhodiola kirilowii]